MANFFVLTLCILICKSVRGNELVNQFVSDIVKAFDLTAPTVMSPELLDLCMDSQWVLCLTNTEGDSIEDMTAHLSLIHLKRKQDSVIFVGNQIHHQLIQMLSEAVPTLFNSNCPVFVPVTYSDLINLTFDSNIIFYEVDEKTNSSFTLIDKFAANGQPFRVELGTWNGVTGVDFLHSKNRWDRRTDLSGVTIVNGLYENDEWADFIYDNENNVVGSTGWLQDWLFYIRDRLGFTILTKRSPQKELGGKPLENGSWTGCVGMLQRKEIDVCSAGLGMNLPRTQVIGFTMPPYRLSQTLIGPVLKGTSPNMWVYLRVFGVVEWFLFLSLVIALAASTLAFNGIIRQWANDHDTERSVLASVYLYTLQMGTHPRDKHSAIRFLSITLSMLTLLVFTYYTTQITAEMTSGPPEIPVSTFEDVIHYDYKVIVYSDYHKNVLAEAHPGSAKYQVYENQVKGVENRDTYIAAMKEVVSDTKTLLYSDQTALVSRDPIQ